MVAANNANADVAYSTGKLAADAITGNNYADAKLKRNDIMVSIAMSRNAIVACGQDVELNPTLLLMRVTCAITVRAEMVKNLEYEFSSLLPYLRSA